MPIHPQLSSTQTETDVQISEATLLVLQSQQIEEKQVILHFTYHTNGFSDSIRIWPSTYLVPQPEGEMVQLKHAYNIGIYPNWLHLAPNKTHVFTLVFGALPKSCESFHLWEKIPEPGGFILPHIKRNKTDVYHLRL